jgi:hypothetical protein
MGTQNIKDLRPSNSIARTRIPHRLQKIETLRFVLIKKGKKRPAERKWESKRNYSADEPSLQGHLAAGGNYGVACGFGGLAVFDSDEEDRLHELGVLDKLPRTFTVRTGGGGTHRYYFCPTFEKKITFYDPVLKDPEHPDNQLHLGEIQWKGQQVVGPGSIHPNGNRYEVIDDTEIATISNDQILEAIKELKINKKIIRDKAKKTKHKKHIYSSDGIGIKDIAWPDGDVQKREGKNGTEYFGAHPVHGSRTGKNFHINVDRDTWYCHRCNSGGGPLEWIAVKYGIISCGQAGPRCLKGEKYGQVLERAKGLGYEINKNRQPDGQFEAIEKRFKSNILPENLPPDRVLVIKAPPRIGKTHDAVKQEIKAGSGIYITHNHSIVSHALHDFKKQGGRSAVHLEGKSRPGMCRKQAIDCRECEFCPNQQDDSHISYTELERRAQDLLREHGILTKEKIPLDLCPYYTLKLAEKSANYCFTVPHFIEDIKPRRLIVLDEDPTLSHFYPPSPLLFRYKSEKTENDFENILGKALEQAPQIKERIEKKGRKSEEDKMLMWSINSLGGINEVIKTTMSGECSPQDCCYKIEEQLTQESKVTYDDDLIEKAITKLDEYHIDNSSEVDLRDYIVSRFYILMKKPLFTLSSGRSGYRSVHLIGDATRPVINMKWSDTAMNSGSKILIIGNTLAELFGKTLGNAVVIEISDFKYAKNYAILPVDSSGENTYEGQVKNQRLKVKKIIKAVAGSPDNEERHPVMVLAGSKRNQDALIRSIGGICHASQEEEETGQQWNFQSGTVNVFYQNSTISRGLDVDQYNVLFVHDADFAQPFWSAAIEAGEDFAKEILNSIIMDETTNSVLRISPVVGGDELRPKIIIIPRNDLWKVRYIDDRVLDGNRGGRTPDIEDIAALITESNLVSTISLNEDRTVVNKELKGPDWEKAVYEDKLLDIFKIELGRVCSRGKYTEEELIDTEKRILDVLKRDGKGRWISIKNMRAQGLRCKDALIRPALERLHYRGQADWKKSGKRTLWSLK